MYFTVLVNHRGKRNRKDRQILGSCSRVENL